MERKKYRWNAWKFSISSYICIEQTNKQTKTVRMKSKRKILQMSIEYHDTGEAVRAIEKMIKQLRQAQTNFGREFKNGVLIQWGVKSEEITAYRVEVVNGKECIIIPSKMNDHE